MINEFMEQYDVILTHFAYSPKTATLEVANYTCSVQFQYGATIDQLAEDFEVTIYDSPV